MSTVPHENKFSRYDPCPICGGDPSQPHGSGRRCWGFYSDDRKRAHCTREEYAGGLPQHPNSSTFAHRLGGACKCGATHGEAGDVPDRSGWRPKARRTHDQMSSYWTRQGYRYVTTYMICDAAGVLVACHDRFEHPSQPKVCPFRLHDGLEGLDGLPKSQLPLYRSETIMKAPAGAPIYLTEGEKACEALREHDLIAVATVTGAGGLPCDDSLRVLSGRTVRLWPDHDTDGAQHMRRIAERLAVLD